MTRIFIPHVKGTAITNKVIFIPEKVRNYRFKAVACGGNGGNGSATKPGGGGGAGSFLDFSALLQPNSLVLISLADLYVDLQFNYYQSAILTDYFIQAGNNGGAAGAVAGLGGDSGCGGEGGTLISAETRFGSGMSDADNLAHTCGGQAGWDIAPSTLNVDFSYTRGPAATIQRCKNKFPSCDSPLVVGTTGGWGGCSYFGGSRSGKSDWGAGGNGGVIGLGVGGTGGDAFFSLEWDD